MTTLGIDLGATNVKMVVVSADDEVTRLESFPTGGERGHDAAIAGLIARARSAADEYGATSVGVGTPGLFDPATGVVTLFTNLPGQWIGVPLRDLLEEGLERPVTLINDARAFTLAEGTLGAGRGRRMMAGLTLGTGVGGGLLIEGRLHFGATGSAGEIAHQTVDPQGDLCGCGNRGCAEAAARAETLIARSGRATLEEVYTGFEDGDPDCVAAVDHAAVALGVALANVVTVVGPEIIVIGGGIVASMGEAALGPIREATRARVTLVPHDDFHIVAGVLGTTAGAVGAALAARDHLASIT